jgi:hypothetical protein
MCISKLLGLFLAMAISGGASAQQYFRIGTGGTGGTYYPVGQTIAAAISQPGKIVVNAQTSNGSLGNVIGIASGALESGFSQADVATWAHTGTGIFEGKPALSGLRLIANLYPESIHVVVKKTSAIQGVADLRGKQVSMDEVGSGTLINARQVLAAYGLKESDIKPHYVKPNQAGDMLAAGGLDAFFFTGGIPAQGISQLAASGAGIRLLPIDGPAAERLRSLSPFLFKDTIAADSYPGVAATETLAVGAQWLTSDKADKELVYQLVKTLYGHAGQKALLNGHPKARFITLTNAVRGAGVPLHPGASRYYEEAGVLK